MGGREGGRAPLGGVKKEIQQEAQFQRNWCFEEGRERVGLLGKSSGCFLDERRKAPSELSGLLSPPLSSSPFIYSAFLAAASDG